MPKFRVVHGSLKLPGGVVASGDKRKPGAGDEVELSLDEAAALGAVVVPVSASHAAPLPLTQPHHPPPAAPEKVAPKKGSKP